MMEDYLPFVYKVVAQYSHGPEPVKDRIEYSIGCEALVVAWNSFDTSCGMKKFPTYLAYMIKYRIIDGRREIYGRKGQKQLPLVPIEFDVCGHAEKEDTRFDDVMSLATDSEKELLNYYLSTGTIPNGSNYKGWCRMKERMQQVMK